MHTITVSDLEQLVKEVGGTRNATFHEHGKIRGFSKLHEEYVRIRFGVPEDVWYAPEYNIYSDSAMQDYISGINNGSVLDPMPGDYQSVRAICEANGYPIEKLLGQYGPKELSDVKYVANWEFESYVSPKDADAVVAYIKGHGN